MCFEGEQSFYRVAWKQRIVNAFISRLEMFGPEDPFMNTTMRKSDAPSFLHLD